MTNGNVGFNFVLLSSLFFVFPLDSTCSTESQLKSLRYVSQLGRHLKRVPRQTSYEDEVCMASFNIDEGQIIRVHDSEKLGARFLNETDLGLGTKSREECLKFCCRTRGCNVNIFEEKETGSCYLFDCGPSESRCIFTAAPKYTVGILRKRNFGPPPPSPYRENQHESELSQLRSLEGADLLKSNFGFNNDLYASPSRPFPSHFPNQQHQQTLQLKPEPALVLLPQQQQQLQRQNLQNQNQQQLTLDFRQPNYEVEQSLQRPFANNAGSTVAPPSGILGSDGQNKPQEPHQHHQQQQQPQQSAPAQQAQQEPLPQVQQRRASCHRNQFECKSSGECIAIYNACDGIPQCSDGSDEAPELHCPSDPTAINYGPPPKPQQQDQNNPKQVGVSNSGYLIPGSPFQSPQQSGASTGFNRPVQQQQQTEDFRYAQAGALPQQNQQQQSPLLTSGSHNGGKSDSMLPPTYQQQQQQTSGQEGLKSFHHKDGGVMEDSYANPAQGQRFGPYWKPNPVDYSTGELSQNGNGGYQLVPVQGNYPGANGYGGYNNNMPSNTYQQQAQQGYLAAQQGNQQQYGLPYGASGSQLQQQQQGTNYQQQPGPGLYNPGSTGPAAGVAGASTAKATNATLATQQATPTLTSSTTPSSASTSDPKLGVYYKDISKLEIPQNLRSLTEQIEAFARETEHDTTSHTAGAGAYFAFMAGLVMSVAMAFLVGCRLRRMGYRRRGKNRLDPDYLVDGMYL